MKLHDAYEAFVLCNKSHGLSPATHRWYEQRLSRLIRFLNEREVFDVEQVTTTHLRLFSVSLQEQEVLWADHPSHPPSDSCLSPHTIRGYLRAVRRFFRWLMIERVIEINPARGLYYQRRSKDAPKEIPTKDRDRLLKAAESDPRDYAVVCFLIDTACRVGGLVSVSTDKLDIDNGEAIVEEKCRGGPKVRPVYFTGRTKKALRRWMEKRPDCSSDAVFLSKKTNKPLTTSGVYQLLKRLAKRAGVEDRYNPHAFRHGWAREALRSGANLSDVSQVLGHRSKKVTMEFYSNWTNPELKKRHGKFSPFAE